ncbi:MAG: ABC transporter ATP-binding protein [Caldilineaceae bacterium]|nr:ABC transporter ATP-binding protein [Caldilineaceae bacterium]
MVNNQNTILQVENLHTHFFTESGIIRALRGVDFSVERGKVLGIVGESGCGKSVTAQCIMNMLPSNGRVVEGKITYYRQDPAINQIEAIDINSLPPRGRAMRAIRGNEIAMIFQEPMTSLDPVYTTGSQLMEAITLHQNVTKQEGKEIAIDALAKVNLPEPARIFDAYPHQLSGGQRQRVMIAIALSCNPTLLIADEPTTALDVTTQAQILDLMRALQEETHMSIIFITHDLGVVAEMCDDVAVMYLGKAVERTDVDTTFHNPQHPYTRALLRSIPRLDAENQYRLDVIKGRVPDPSVVPSGCPFHPRCPEMVPGLCEVYTPEVISIGDNHQVRCLLHDDKLMAQATTPTAFAESR